jgi:hypothetical protein
VAEAVGGRNLAIPQLHSSGANTTEAASGAEAALCAPAVVWTTTTLDPGAAHDAVKEKEGGSQPPRGFVNLESGDDV